MVNFKRVLSAVLAGCMVVSLAACSNGDKENNKDDGNNTAVTEPREDGSNPGAISETTISPVYFHNTGTYLYEGTEPVFETIEYYTNIKFEDLSVPLSAYNEKVSTVLASNDLPDLMCLRSATMAKEYGGKGAFLDLTDYIENGKMPSFKKLADEHEPALSLSKDGEGKIWGTPRIYEIPYMDSSWQMRTDLLEKHNLESPKDPQGLYDMLVKLKELYPDSYPYASRWGMYSFSGISSLFDVDTSMVLDYHTREYKFGPADPEFPKAVQMFKDMYQNGLVNPEFATISDEEYFEQITNNKGFIVSDYQIGDKMLKDVGLDQLPEGWEFETIVQPNNSDGDRHGLFVLSGYYGMTRCIAKDSEYAEELVRYLDWTYSEEGRVAMELGIKGKMWTEDENGTVTYTDAKYDPNQNENTGLHNQDFMTVKGEKGLFGLDVRPDTCAARAYELAEKEDLLTHEPYVYASWYDKDKQKEYGDLLTPINTYMEEATMKMILGDMEISELETTVLPQVEKMGYKRCLELVNEALDNTLGR